MGIGERGDEVYTVCYGDLGAVISNSPIIIRYPISRKNTLAHQLVMEKVMKDHTTLPVRFGTIAEGDDKATPEERIRQKVLKERYAEFDDLLGKMNGKVELGVKALWKDMDMIFEEILEEKPKIKRLRDKWLDKPLTQDEAIAIGEMVKSALEAKKAKEANEILSPLKEISCDFRVNETHGDSMITNSAFLVEVEREKEFDDMINELDARYGERIKFRYVGPVPPCNFVEIVVIWD